MKHTGKLVVYNNSKLPFKRENFRPHIFKADINFKIALVLCAFNSEILKELLK